MVDMLSERNNASPFLQEKKLTVNKFSFLLSFTNSLANKKFHAEASA